MRLIIIGFTVCILAVATYAQAAVYRCTNEAGEVIFTQKPCASDQQGEQLNITVPKQNKEIDPAVCKDVRYLAELIFPHIAQEESILKVYDDLGGRSNLSAGVTGVVNYVYNFRYNPEAKQAEVVRLTHEKCLEKGFGYIGKKDLPNWEKIKYSIKNEEEKQQAGTTADAEQIQDEQDSCENYAIKLKYLQEKLEQPLDKSDRLRLQSDKEYLEHLQKEQCAKKE